LKNLFLISSQQGAQVTLICATSSPDLLFNGGYYHNTCGRMILSPDDPAMNSKRANEFFQMTQKIIEPFLWQASRTPADLEVENLRVDNQCL
jgi:hypothetical protein